LHKKYIYIYIFAVNVSILNTEKYGLVDFKKEHEMEVITIWPIIMYMDGQKPDLFQQEGAIGFNKFDVQT
jgi:hypothetical protein